MTLNLADNLQINLLAHMPSGWALIAGILLLGTFLLSVRYAYKRLMPERALRFVAVCMLNVLAYGALLMLLSQVQYRAAQLQQGILVTAGSAAPISELASNLPADTPIWFTPDASEAIQQQDLSSLSLKSQPQSLAQPEDIVYAMPQIQQLHVLGDGLTPAQWHGIKQRRTQDAEPLSVKLSDYNPITGAVGLSWQRQLLSGQWQKVTGTLQLAADVEAENLQQTLYHFKLLDPAGQQVALQTLREGEQFEFIFTAKSPGLWQYQLQLFDDLGQPAISQQPIAFEVSQAQTARMLIHQSAPSFETRNIQNWASEQGAQLTIETQISQTRFISQHFNYPHNAAAEKAQADADALNSVTTLAQYDIVMIDGRALVALSQTQQDNLSLAVEQGLGVLVFADASLLTQQQTAQWLSKIDIQPAPADAATSSLLRWQYYQAEQPVSHLAAVLSGSQTRTLVTDRQGRNMVVAAEYGLGQVAITLTSKSHQWRTAGQQTAFSHYWHYLLEQLGRQSSQPSVLAQSPDALPLATQSQLLCFTARTDLQQPPQAYAFSYQAIGQPQVELLPQVDKLNQNKACSPIYPIQSGWHQAQFSLDRVDNDQDTAQSSFYVYQKSHWQAWQQHQKRQASLKVQASSAEVEPRNSWFDVTYWPFWWCWFVCISLLWIERKF